MESLLQDLRYAVRAMVRRPGITVLAMLTFGLGIAASTAMFSYPEFKVVREQSAGVLALFEAERNHVHDATTDPITMVTTAMLLAAAAVVAALPSGVRAARVDPMEALRAE